MTSRREFIRDGAMAAAGALGATATAQNVADNTGMVWGLLLHFGNNFFYRRKPLEKLEVELDAFRRITERMAADGLNMVLIDVLEASHPELGIAGSYEPEAFVAELDRLRALGLEPLPKLNFSTAHHDWLGKYSRMVSSPTYYQVCADVIRDTAKMFGGPRYFHIGMDEESLRFLQRRDVFTLRQGDQWWHDLGFLQGEVEKQGARAWMWCDRFWYHHDEFCSRASRKIVMANYFYSHVFDVEYYRKIIDKDPIGYYGLTSYAELEKADFDQIPTCSNYMSPGYRKNHPGFRNLENTFKTMEWCKARISPAHLKGFLSAPWAECTAQQLDYHYEASRILGEAKRRYEAGA